MAFCLERTFEMIYTNDRMRMDETFKSNYPQLPIEHKETITVPNAYVVVRNLHGNKNKLTYLLDIYKDSEKTCLLESAEYAFVPDVSNGETPNFYVQAYNHAKGIPEYKGAIDC